MTHAKSAQQGISLVETLIVIATISILVVLIASVSSSVATIGKTRSSSLAKDIASRELDYLRKIGYANLANGNNTFTDSDLSRLPFGTGKYEISDCPVTVCTKGEKTKQVKVTINWVEQGNTKTAELMTLVGEGGIGQ